MKTIISLLLTLFLLFTQNLHAQTGAIGYQYTPSSPVGLYGAIFNEKTNIGGYISFSSSFGINALPVSYIDNIGDVTNNEVKSFDVSVAPLFSLTKRDNKLLGGVAVGFRGANVIDLYESNSRNVYFDKQGWNIVPTVSPFMIINNISPLSFKLGFTLVGSTKNSIPPHSLDIGIGFSF